MGSWKTSLLISLLVTLLATKDGCDAFLKAALGLRIGLSPTEKGYGQPQEHTPLHNAGVKGQFLTGVHGTPPEAHGQNHGHVRGQEAPPGSPAGTALLRHLKILGVNLYLGGPKGPHHHVKSPPHNDHNAQQQRPGPGHPGPVQGLGQRGQYAHHHEFKTIDAQNSLGSFSSPSSQLRHSVPPPNSSPNEIFVPAASQYQSPHFSNEVQQVNYSPAGPSPSGPPPQQNVASHPHPSGPPPKQHGFPLMSLMRGPQWTSRPLRFRIPLMMNPFLRRPQQPSPHLMHVNHHPHGQLPSQSSPQLQYSTLYSTAPSNQHNLAAPQMQIQGSAYPLFNPQQQSQNGFPYSMYPYASPPHQNHPQGPQQPHFNNHNRFPDQGQSPSGTPQFTNQQPQQFNGPHSYPMQGSNQYASLPQNREQEYGPSEYQINFPQQGQGQDQYTGFNHQPQSGPMPDDFRPPLGFEYSHTDSSPIVSMGTTSYDDPPVMMDMGEGQPQSYNEPQNVQGYPESSPNHEGQTTPNFRDNKEYSTVGNQEDEAQRRVSQSQVSKIVRNPTQIQAPQNAFSVRAYPAASSNERVQLQKIQVQGRSQNQHHLQRSLKKWNPLLEKYNKMAIERTGVSDMTQAGTEVSTKLQVIAPKTLKTPEKIEKTKIIRIRSTTTASPTSSIMTSTTTSTSSTASY